MKNIFKAAVFVLVLGISSLAKADVYTIDPAHTTIGFSVSHMMVSEVSGVFNDLAGTVDYDPQNVAATKIDVTIQAASIDTRQEGRDEHLRKPEFFDAEKYPAIIFKSAAVTQNEGTLMLEGDLTIKDVTKKVSIPLRINGPVKNGDKTLIGLGGVLMVNRQDYGVSFSKQMDTGGLVVGNDVKISFSVEAKSN